MTVSTIHVVVGVEISSKDLYIYLLENDPKFRDNIEHQIPHCPLLDKCVFICEPSEPIETAIFCSIHENCEKGITTVKNKTVKYIHRRMFSIEDYIDHLRVGKPRTSRKIGEAKISEIVDEMQELYCATDVDVEDYCLPGTDLKIYRVTHDINSSTPVVVGIAVSIIYTSAYGGDREETVIDNSAISVDSIVSAHNKIKTILATERVSMHMKFDPYLLPELVDIIYDYGSLSMGNISLHYIQNDCGCCS